MNGEIPDILKKIVDTKKQEVAAYSSRLNEFKANSRDQDPPLDFVGALSGETLSIIAEIKKASPSAGIIADDFDPLAIAAAYCRGNADAISVLTDQHYFKGDPQYIPLIRDITPIPILRKDFIIDPVQIYQARCLGADSFLLIAAILSVPEITEFIGIGRELGMEPLVEVHCEEELEKALEARPKIIGINNRNLHTFEVSLKTSEKLVGQLPRDAISVSESGIYTADQALRLHQLGFSALLVGQSLMEAGLAGCGVKISQFKGEL